MVPSLARAKKLVALCLCVLLTAGAWAPLVTTDRENTTAAADPAWEITTGGARGDQILIRNVHDLQNMSKDITAHYALANDIDASATREWNDGAGFEPVGAGSWDGRENHFTGSLDGGGYAITGLFIDRSGTNYVGLFGSVGSGGTVKNVGLVDVDVTGDTGVGGLVGSNQGGSMVSNSLATGSVSGTRSIGGLVGLNHRGSVSNSHYNIDAVLINGANHVTLGGLFHDQYQDWFDSSMELDIADYDSTLVPSGDFYEISTVNGVRDLLGFAGTTGFKFRLVSDIDLSTATNLNIPYLAAEFDGNNHTISHLLIDQSFASRVGMFAAISSGGTVKNVGLVDMDISGWDYVGGLVGLNWYSSVENCYATGSVSGNSLIGGLVGFNSNGSVVSNSYATGNVNGTQWVGGLVGVNGGSVSNCYATGSVSGSITVGGLVGWNSGSVSNCYATGSVTGERWVGGLVGGYVDDGSVENSFYDKDTTGQSDTRKGTPKSTAQMKTRATFTSAGWDFNDVWWLIETITYPLLRWQIVIIAVAGADQAVDEGTQVIFDGGTSASLDGGGIMNYTWSFHDGTEDIMLFGVAPDHIFLKPGIFIVMLTVTDATGNWDTDTMTVIVDSTPPVANAGPNRTVDEGTQVTLNASASTDNIGIANYTWTFQDGTKDTILYGIAPTHTFTVPGVYVVTLTVTDMAGNRDTDTLHVTVRDITPPMADAGPDRSVKEGAQVTFDGSASSDNVGVINYTWAFTYNGTEVLLYGVSPSFLFWTPGDYTVTLMVMDAAGFEDSDTMILRVSIREEDGATNALIWFLLVVLVVLLLVLFIVVTGKGIRPPMKTGEPVKDGIVKEVTKVIPPEINNPPVGTEDRSTPEEQEPHSDEEVAFPGATPPDFRPPPPEDDIPVPESFRPPTEPAPEQTDEGGQSSPDDGPPDPTPPAAGPLSSGDLPPSPGVAPPSVAPPDQPGTIAKTDPSPPPGAQSCPGCGKEASEEEPSCPDCGFRRDGGVP